MEYLPLFATIFFAHIVLLMSPGPNALLIAQVSASQSRRAGLLVSLGVATGGFIWPLLAILGLSVIFNQILWLYLAIKYLGALYLVYLGFKSWRDAKKPLSALSSEVSPRRKSFYTLGLMTTLLNPKVLVFMGSFFAAMLPVESPIWVKAVVLAMFTFNSIWWHTLLAYALSTSRVQRGYGAIKLWLDRVVGVFFVALGLRLAVSGRSS